MAEGCVGIGLDCCNCTVVLCVLARDLGMKRDYEVVNLARKLSVDNLRFCGWCSVEALMECDHRVLCRATSLDILRCCGRCSIEALMERNHGIVNLE